MVKKFKEGRWDLTDILKNHKGKEFENLLKELESKVEKFESFRVELRPDISVNKLLDMLKVAEEIKIISGRIGAYAGLWTSMNTKNQEARAFEHKMSNYLSELGNKMIFFSLWFKSLDDENMNRVIREAGVYSYYFERIKAGKQYALTEAEEKIINIKDVTGGEALNSIYDVITNAFIYDFKINRKVKKVTGDELRSNFSNPNAKIRERSYKLLLNKYGENKDSLGEIYKNIVTEIGRASCRERV